MDNQTRTKHYKATLSTIKIILDAISQGLTQRDASTLAGISEDTLCLWKKKNSDFSEQIRQKQIECKLRHIKVVNEASKSHWQASAWWSERKHKEEFALNAKLNIELDERLEKIGENIRKILTSSKQT